MHAEFLLGAGIILVALAVAGISFLRLRQSIIPAFILLGVALRPDGFDQHLVDTIATVGVVLLLFFMGLEFSLGALVRNRRRIVRTGGVDLLVVFPVGLVAGLALGYGWDAALLLAGAFVWTRRRLPNAWVSTSRRPRPLRRSAFGPALHAAAPTSRPVLGVACGSIGVLTSVPAGSLSAALDQVAAGRARISLAGRCAARSGGRFGRGEARRRLDRACRDRCARRVHGPAPAGDLPS